MDEINSDIIIQAIHNKGIETVRNIVYGIVEHSEIREAEAMRLFIESRQNWCKKAILKELKQ